jgi:hypothetical protein
MTPAIGKSAFEAVMRAAIVLSLTSAVYRFVAD